MERVLIMNNRGIYNKLRLSRLPISVYDVEQKKLIAIFSSARDCSAYFFPHRKYKRDGGIDRYIKGKSKSFKNYFNKVLAFRYSNSHQREILAEENFVILDEEYRKKH